MVVKKIRSPSGWFIRRTGASLQAKTSTNEKNRNHLIYSIGTTFMERMPFAGAPIHPILVQSCDQCLVLAMSADARETNAPEWLETAPGD